MWAAGSLYRVNVPGFELLHQASQMWMPFSLIHLVVKLKTQDHLQLPENALNLTPARRPISSNPDIFATVIINRNPDRITTLMNSYPCEQ